MRGPNLESRIRYLFNTNESIFPPSPSPAYFTMAASKTDYQIASLAAGFTIGFGFLTVWEAMKQTRRNRNPLRSTYIYMMWGEIVANLVIAVIGWLFLDGILGPT